MNVPEKEVRGYLHPDAALDADEERNMRKVIARPFDSENQWSWKWIARLLATIDKLRGHVTCFRCGGGGIDGIAVCPECLGNGTVSALRAPRDE